MSINQQKNSSKNYQSQLHIQKVKLKEDFQD